MGSETLADMILYLERRQPDLNRLRFYRVEVGCDLFGTWCLTRRWGRIGTRGQSCRQSYGSEVEARAAAERLTRQKAGRGYRPAGPV